MQKQVVNGLNTTTYCALGDNLKETADSNGRDITQRPIEAVPKLGTGKINGWTKGYEE